MFNSKHTIEINQKILIAKKLAEQQEEMRIMAEIQEAERQRIDEWWKNEQKKIKPWSKEEKAFYTKFTFSS